MSVGYATLYGDMAGGFAVIKDVFKLLVYRLVRWRNEQEGGELIPASVLERPPSAELRPGPARRGLPAALRDCSTGSSRPTSSTTRASRRSSREGLPEETVREVVRLVDRAEYKRRQAPPGIRVSTKAFGRDRRLPITNRFGSMRKLPR